MKVQHKEPTPNEPNFDPSQTYFGVMSKVYNEAFAIHEKEVNCPEYIKLKEG